MKTLATQNNNQASGTMAAQPALLAIEPKHRATQLANMAIQPEQPAEQPAVMAKAFAPKNNSFIYINLKSYLQ